MESEPDRVELSGLTATTERLRHLARSLPLTEEGYACATRAAGVIPNAPVWHHMISRFLMIYGAAMVLVGIAAFFAYNWSDLHRFAKFGLIQTGIVSAVWLAWRCRLDSIFGRSALFGAASLTGMMLAVYGQSYQTGADPYGLFLGWAALVGGWAVIGRQPALWLLMVVLANLGLVLYWEQVLYPRSGIGEFSRILGPLAWLGGMLTDSRLAQWVFALNASTLLTWEFFSARGVVWMQSRWFPRLIASAALATILASTLVLIFSSFGSAGPGFNYATPVLYALFTATCIWYYRKRCRDLYVLAACLLGMILIVNAVIARGSGNGHQIALLLSLLLIGQTAGAVIWLRGVARNWRRAS